MFKKIVTGILLTTTLALAACKGSTQYGECVGILDEDARDPDLRYELSTRNLVWTIIFSETLLVPIVWAVGYSHCPVGHKAKKVAE
jgi:hypothetical protein